MNSLHGIKITNDAAAVRGRLLEYNAETGLLYLEGEPLSPYFPNRDAAEQWASRNQAKIAPPNRG